jgi:hypothetical protein
MKRLSFVDEIVPYATEQDLEDILNPLRVMFVLLETNEKNNSLVEITVKQGIAFFISIPVTIGSLWLRKEWQKRDKRICSRRCKKS